MGGSISVADDSPNYDLLAQTDPSLHDIATVTGAEASSTHADDKPAR
jgi:hypothetical protein